MEDDRNKGKGHDDNSKGHDSYTPNFVYFKDGSFCVSQRVWNVSGICKDFGVARANHCWPFLLSAKQGPSRQAVCGRNSLGHADVSTGAHKAIPKFNPAVAAIIEKYSRAITNEEHAKYFNRGSNGSKGKGRGAGNGRGRGRQGPRQPADV